MTHTIVADLVINALVLTGALVERAATLANAGLTAAPVSFQLRAMASPSASCCDTAFQKQLWSFFVFQEQI